MSHMTAGSWRAASSHFARAEGWGSFVVKAADGRSVCCCTSNSTRPPAEIMANGLAIAAVPKLLAALEKWAAFALDNGYSVDPAAPGYVSFLADTFAALELAGVRVPA
jgi:hypothetical protein